MKIAMAHLLTLRGTTYLYFGEEIGMAALSTPKQSKLLGQLVREEFK